MKIVAIIQARMRSTRLPGKALMDLEGKRCWTRVVNRLRRSQRINELLVATTDRPADDAIIKECRSLSVAVSRGDQDDVLDRYFRAAQLSRRRLWCASPRIVLSSIQRSPIRRLPHFLKSRRITPRMLYTAHTRAVLIRRSCPMRLGVPGGRRGSPTSASM